MTLDTRVYILDPVDVEELFAWCNTNLIQPDHEPIVERNTKGDKYERWEGTHSMSRVANRFGQGFSAILDIQHLDGDLIDPLDDAVDEEDREYYAKYPKHYAVISFDTGYGYRGEINGHPVTCSGLHSWFIFLLARYFEEKNIRFAWQNEFTGEIFEGLDGIETLIQGGNEAVSWFENIAKPAIVNDVVNNGGKSSDIQW